MKKPTVEIITMNLSPGVNVNRDYDEIEIMMSMCGESAEALKQAALARSSTKGCAYRAFHLDHPLFDYLRGIAIVFCSDGLDCWFAFTTNVRGNVEALERDFENLCAIWECGPLNEGEEPPVNRGPLLPVESPRLVIIEM